MASLMDILAGAGNLLDLPGSSLRDILSGRNPFDQWMTPFSDVNRASGRDVLQPFLGANEETGMSGWMDNPMEGFKDIAGFGAEMLLDPLNLVPLGAVGKALKGRKAARSANAAMKAERGGKYAMVNPKVAGRVAAEVAPANPMRVANWQDEVARLETDRLNLVGQADDEGMGTASIFQDLFGETPDTLAQLDKAGLRQQYDELGKRIDEIRSQNPMKLLGYTPDREVVYHGGRDWSASATPQNPYGMFDVSHLKTGEGGNMFGPGAYFADAESTSRNYQELVRDKLKRGLVDDPELLSEYFTPGRIVPSYSGQDQVVGFSPTGATRPGASGWTVQVRSIEPGHTPDKPKLGPLRTHSTSPRFQEVYTALGRKPPEARLYQLDMPPGSKDQFIKWDNPMSDQPTSVSPLVDKFNNVTGAEGIGKLQELRSFYQTIEDDLDAMRGQKFLSAEEKAKALSMEKQADSLREQAELVRQSLLKAGVPQSMLKANAEDINSGSGLLEFFMKKDPSEASIEEAQPLIDAGVPGSKNLAASTGRTSYNYAIWDQNLLNQMRVRAIDGQRVPINPTTLVEQVQQPVARATDSPLMSTMNPMQLQPEPSPFPAAVAGAVYNALQAFNGRGGIQ